MYEEKVIGKFKKDYKLIQKQHKDIQTLKNVIDILKQGKPLDSKYKDHKIHGEYEGCRECHLTPDWLLIYKIDKESNILWCIRTGSHSELFESIISQVNTELENVLYD